MPLIPTARDFLDVDVSDRTPGVKQRARWLSMLATQNPLTGAVSVQLQVQVSQYTQDEAGGYGERLTGKGINAYPVPLIADNNSAVDPQTGAVRYMRTAESDADWQALLESKPEPLMLQGDWFLALMSQQIAITPLLRGFMEQADQPPFSKFS